MASVASLTAGLSPEQLLLLKEENHDVQVYTYAIVFTILTILAVIVRVTSRHMKKVAVDIDDLLVILALVKKPILHHKAGLWADEILCERVISTAQTTFICVGKHFDELRSRDDY